MKAILLYIKHHKLLIGSIIVFIATVLWLTYLAPQLVRLPDDFNYSAEIISKDNFYNSANQEYFGEQFSATKFSFYVEQAQDDLLLINNSFEVKQFTGEPIINIKRLYAIEPYSMQHVAGFGDHDRHGYLFAPRHLRKGQPFMYWHVNYDGSANMEFVEEENLGGLKVYRYETNFRNVSIDQTNNLTHLPEVGLNRGVELDPYLQVWIEPYSGHMVKYQDETTAYYYNLQTKMRMYPWNHFTNKYTDQSIAEHIQLAKFEKQKVIIIDHIIPLLLLTVFIAMNILALYKNPLDQKMI